MAGSLQSIVISDADALSSVENDWWDLWSRSPAATVFQSPAWLIPWWQIFEPGSLRMIAIHQGKRLVGLAPPFVRYKKGAPWLFPLGRGISDYTDILVDADCQSTSQETNGTSVD
jgi:CelD/BcsL family acetyltransferase involved in cellulose biosynthesis